MARSGSLAEVMYRPTMRISAPILSAAVAVSAVRPPATATSTRGLPDTYILSPYQPLISGISFQRAVGSLCVSSVSIPRWMMTTSGTSFKFFSLAMGSSTSIVSTNAYCPIRWHSRMNLLMVSGDARPETTEASAVALNAKSTSNLPTSKVFRSATINVSGRISRMLLQMSTPYRFTSGVPASMIIRSDFGNCSSIFL
ncbi:MAG: hypothetical protein RBG13Loki_0431 [Promethearchaeota archaeon CR_4]|nr:MAG: hypothetical protein RBG13Loki_0431 [Candidatus Lokiarchaeota archaeon CR_4]